MIRLTRVTERPIVTLSYREMLAGHLGTTTARARYNLVASHNNEYRALLMRRVFIVVVLLVSGIIVVPR